MTTNTKRDGIFKALADPSRRKLLDELFKKDGQTLLQLQGHLVMTRFGCMKHLEILEAAGLLSTRKIGREKFHYLNPVPIQLVYDRWVSKYAQPFAQGLVDLKSILEEEAVKKYTHVYEILIRTTPEKLWQALIDGSMTQQYYFGTRIQSTFKLGAPYQYLYPQGNTALNPEGSGLTSTAMIDGEVLIYEQPKKLVTTFRPLWAYPNGDAPISRVTFEIEPQGAVCKLSLTHEDLEIDNPLTQSMIGGWTQIMSGLKTLLETGEPLVTAA